MQFCATHKGEKKVLDGDSPCLLQTYMFQCGTPFTTKSNTPAKREATLFLPKCPFFGRGVSLHILISSLSNCLGFTSETDAGLFSTCKPTLFRCPTNLKRRSQFQSCRPHSQVPTRQTVETQGHRQLTKNTFFFTGKETGDEHPVKMLFSLVTVVLVNYNTVKGVHCSHTLCSSYSA